MTDQSRQGSRWLQFAIAIVVTVGFAVIVGWIGRSYGRTAAFALGVNWILMGWAITLGRVLESRSGAWDGLSSRLPECYYATRKFEKGGRVYDRLGVRWYQRWFRVCLWSVKPPILRSQPDARQAMVRATRAPEAGHLVIFVAIIGITVWALVSGWWGAVAWLTLFNLLHNGYPVLSMRQIRARLDRPNNRLERTAGDELPRHEGQRAAAELRRQTTR
jgi:hypothetical protein